MTPREQKVFNQWQEVCNEINGRPFAEVRNEYESNLLYEDDDYLQVQDIDGQLDVYIDRQEDGTARVSGDNVIIVSEDGSTVETYYFEKQL